MKYNITLNQPLMMENNLNVTQWCILDIISIAPTWCNTEIKDNEVYYWVARQKISEELKALNLKPDTIYRNIKKLADLGFLEYKKYGKKDLIRLSKRGKNIFVAMSEINPNYYVGNKSEQNSEINPTYNNTNLNNNTNIKEKNIKKEKPKPKSKKDLVIDILKEIDLNFVNKKSLNEWLEFKNWNYKKAGITKLVNMLSKYSFEVQQEIVDKSIMNNYQGLFEPKNMSNQPQQFKSKEQQRLDDIDNYFASKNQNNEVIETEIL